MMTHDEEEGAAGRDAADDGQRVDHGGRLAVGGHADQQEGHHLEEGEEEISGARHVGRDRILTM
jgi:hypothetical protein